MIRLTKACEPRVLTDNRENWTREYLEAIETGGMTDSRKFRYRHPDIKGSLRKETNDKCAYCESKISHVHPGETDHILPVSRRPDLCVAWSNLTYVCSECNRLKSDYYSETEPLVNPYDDDPSAHLNFFGPLVLHLDSKGLRTTRQIGLSRPALLERKQERIEEINNLILKWRETRGHATRQFLRREIMRYAADDAEYAATIRAFLLSQPDGDDLGR